MLAPSTSAATTHEAQHNTTHQPNYLASEYLSHHSTSITSNSPSAYSNSQLLSELPLPNESILLSTTFHFTANLGTHAPDTLLVTPDGTVFVVHYHRLSYQSVNLFGGFLPHATDSPHESPLIIGLPERSDVLNVVLHTLYGLPTFVSMPTFECLTASIEALPKYGLAGPLQLYVAPGNALYNALLSHSVYKPLAVYAFAASRDLEALAISSSAYTLHLKPYLMKQELVDRIGALYMYRLHKLHGTRMHALRALLDIMPTFPPHRDAASNTDNHTNVISKAYELAVAQIWFSAAPGESFSHVA